MREDNMMIFKLEPRMRIFGMIAIIAVIVLIVGILISVGLKGFGPREEDDYGRGDMEEWVVKANHVGAMIYYIGVGALSFCLLTIALFSRRMHLYMRIGLIVATALLLGPTLNASYYLIGYM